MQTVGFFSQKGGSGKTTLAIHAAVAAQEDGHRVVLIDCDPQESSAGWGLTRSSEAPTIVKADPSNITDVLKAAKSENYTLAILDCPPHAVAGVGQLVSACRYIVIPCQPTALDVATAGRAVAIVHANKRPFSFVINRAPLRAPENEEARQALGAQGVVCPGLISERRAFARALTGGQSVTEFESDGKASTEIRNFWIWIEKDMKQ